MRRRAGCCFQLMALMLVVGIRRPFACCFQADDEESKFSRVDFPQHFIFGAGTSAYQWEGAAAEDGRSASIWDTFTHSGKTFYEGNGDVASDGYHKYKGDVKLMADTGLDSFRFSISWSRLIPNGRGAVNPKGLAFYNDLIDELLRNGIEPHVTIYHYDMPQVLEDEYGGWLSSKIVEDFTAYADVCFREFGERVKQWTTVVEPNIIALGSYDNGAFPPGRCSYPFGFNCTVGDSTTEPYIVVHNTLLAHASVVELYRKKYKAIQNGSIGLNVYTFWFYPYTDSAADVEAAQRSMDFVVGWIINPIVFGDYPKVMREIVGSRLPPFTHEQSTRLKGSFDYIAVNHYTSIYAKDNSNISMSQSRDVYADLLGKFAEYRGGPLIDQFIPRHIISDPAGLQHLLEYLKVAYGNPPIFIEENGYGLGTKDTSNDTGRITYISAFIGSTLDAIRNGANVKGYYVWSFLDVFEFLAGYDTPFGLYKVDFKDAELRRQPKLSALWYSNFIKRKTEVKIKKSSPHTKLYAEE